MSDLRHGKQISNKKGALVKGITADCLSKNTAEKEMQYFCILALSALIKVQQMFKLKRAIK